MKKTKSRTKQDSNRTRQICVTLTVVARTFWGNGQLREDRLPCVAPCTSVKSALTYFFTVSKGDTVVLFDRILCAFEFPAAARFGHAPRYSTELHSENKRTTLGDSGSRSLENESL